MIAKADKIAAILISLLKQIDLKPTTLPSIYQRGMRVKTTHKASLYRRKT